MLKRFIVLALLRVSSVAGEGVCEDILEYKGIPVNVDVLRYEACSWIDIDPHDTEHRRRVHCDNYNNRKYMILEKCPRACNECCGDNPDFVFPAMTNGEEMGVGCSWLLQEPGRQDQYCNIEGDDSLKVEVSCPYSCGNCPTKPNPVTKPPVASPVLAPTPKKSTAKPSEEYIPDTGGATGGGGYNPPDTTEVTLFMAGDLYSDEKIASENAGGVMNGVNNYFDQINSNGGKVHKMFTALKKKGIKSIIFTSMELNEGITDFKAVNVLCSEPRTKMDSVCNPLVGAFKVVYEPSTLGSSRQIRRLDSNEDSTAALIGALDEVNQQFPDGISPDVDGLNGVFVRNMASDMDSLGDIATADIPASSEGTGGGSANTAKIVAPVVVCVLLVGFIFGAYIIHRKRQKQIIVELEETMESTGEEHFMMSPLKLKRRNTKVVQTEQMMFPVDSGETSNYLPGFDCLCAGDHVESKSVD